MKNTNPFVPQGSLLEQQSKRRSRMKLGVFCVLAVSVSGLMAMLIQGCKRETAGPVEPVNPPVLTNSEFPPFTPTNPAPVVEPTNPPPQPITVVTPPPAEPAGTEYVIVQGDTLGKIAKNNHVTLPALIAANPGIVPTKLKVGKKITLPAPTTSAVTPAATGTPATGSGEEIYVVKSGDTLTKIATTHGLKIKAIEAANNLTTTKIKVGQKLKIPAKAEAAVVTPAPAMAPATPPASSSTMVTPLPPSSTPAH
jgi:LysM repeat protein